MAFRFIQRNGYCEVWQIGKWRLLKYRDGRGWWHYMRNYHG